MLNKLLFFILLIPNIIWAQTRRYELNESASERVIPGIIAVKLKTAPANARSEGFQLTSIEGVVSIEPLHQKPNNLRSDAESILDGIYLVKINEDLSPISFCNQLLRYPEVIYAEAILREELFHTPNDPSAQIGTGNQGYLEVIKAYEAWDITKGSEDIVIGIIDTGADLLHEDLIGKFYQNFGEAPIPNGFDEDGNGYIDDILGYDFADDDTNPQADGSQHGTHVSGIAGAKTNNLLGIASVGYNSKIAPLKGFTTVGTISTGVWEAVIYAADNGYDIVNLSWGSFGYSSQVFQDIIDYCVLDKDMVVIGAAGNTNADLDFYPASYDHVLSVAGTTLTDTKWSNSTYSDFVDISAPALSVYSTQNGDTYNTDSGTSHAAPQVAGVAALVKTVFPEYNARQIMEQVRVTSDNIDNIPGNESYAFKLGKGRLNALRAVTESDSRSLRVHDLKYFNDFGPYAFFGDTLELNFDLTNYLAGLNSPNLTLESTSPYATVLTANMQPGGFQSMETKAQGNVKIVLDNDTPPNTKIGLRFTMTDGGYSDFQNVSIISEPNRHTFENTQISATIIGDGSVGYEDNAYIEGFDLEYKNQPVLRYGGLLIGAGSSDIQDNVTNDFITSIRDDDFQGETNLKLIKNDAIAKFGYSEFSSKNGDYWIEQSIIPSEDKSVLILSYRIINTSGATINNFNAGFFSDFFLGSSWENHAEWDTNLNALVFNDDPQNTFAALKLIGDPYHFMALDMQAENGNSRDVMDSFSDTDKYALLVGADKPIAGALGTGNDVAGIVSVSQPILEVGGEIRLAVVLSLADDYANLENNLIEASSLYDAFLRNPQTLQTFFSCMGNDVMVDPSSGSQFQFFEDALGTVSLGTSNQLLVSSITQDTVIYARNVDGSFPKELRKIKINVIDQVADFSTSTDTLYLDHPTVNTVTFTDLSFRPISWSWDFDIGSASSIQNPAMNFDTPGTYDVALSVSSEIGCVVFITKKIVVANRPSAPVLSSIDICKDETITFSHPTDEYSVYDSDGIQLAKGTTVNLGPYEESLDLRIAQIIDGFESLTTIVPITVDDLSATYSIVPDLSSSENRAVFTYTGKPATAIEWKLDGQTISTNESFSYQIDGADLNLELNVSSTSCQDVLNEVISFSQSPTPVVSNYLLCVSDNVTIQPSNGTYFGFYSDATLTNLILKGNELLLNNLSESQTVYVVGLDGILPSSAVAVNIDLLDFETTILADPPMLDLSASRTVTFSSSYSDIALAKWFVNGELIDQSNSPTLFFEHPGSYQIRLEAINDLGCTTATVLDYVVVSEVTSITNSTTTIYPNPVKRGEKITIGHVSDYIKLIGMDGQSISQFMSADGQVEIPLTLKPGLYLLLIDRKGHPLAVKLIID